MHTPIYLSHSVFLSYNYKYKMVSALNSNYVKAIWQKKYSQATHCCWRGNLVILKFALESEVMINHQAIMYRGWFDSCDLNEHATRPDYKPFALTGFCNDEMMDIIYFLPFLIGYEAGNQCTKVNPILTIIILWAAYLRFCHRNKVQLHLNFAEVASADFILISAIGLVRSQFASREPNQ